jgi:simple sugar transport system permease protein
METEYYVKCVGLTPIIYSMAGKELIGQAQLGEYFRVFVSYGIIALALVLHAWRRMRAKTEARRSLRGDD